MDIEAIVKSKFYGNELEKDYKDNIKFEVACNKLLLPGFRLVEH